MKVIGIGGVSFKTEQPDALRQWYHGNLGINQGFYWEDAEQHDPHYLVWNALPGNSKVFEGTKKSLVITYIVDDLESFLNKLKVDGVTANEKIEKDAQGKSASIIDPEGNKFILWESSGRESKIGVTHSDKVTGLGGVFFKSPEPKKLSQWYADHLGLDATQWGCNFLWHDPNNPNEKVPAITVWNPFGADTTYFNPSKSDFMFNYRVLNLVDLLRRLEASGVQLPEALQEFSYGKFAWALDPDGNKIELWEAVDDGF